MSPDGSQLLILLIVLTIIRAFFTSLEYIIVEVNDAKIKELAEENEQYEKLRDFLAMPTSMLSTFSVHRIFSSMCIGVLAVCVLDALLPEKAYVNLWRIVSAVASTVLVSVAADVIPKRIAEKNVSEKAALSAFPFIKALMIILSPMVFLINSISYVFCRIFGLSSSDKMDVVTEEEILMMVDAGNETGVIEESQKEMINNIFEFSDVKVSEIMTHRTDIVGLDINDRIRDIIYLAINKGFSRMPVYDGSVDKIVGIIYVKDFLCLVGCENPDDFVITDFMREALYIPASNKCNEVFEIMTKKKVQMAVLVDEYGGTAGIVTMEDILEEIVGNIQDEYDEEEQEITKISENSYIISGAADPEDVLPALHAKKPESREYDTMNAMIVDLLGRIPTESESPTVKYDDVEFTVMVVEDNWISRIKAVIQETADEKNESEEES